MKHRHLRQFCICCFCAILGCTFTSPYLSYATTQDEYDAANKELEELRARQNEINSDIASINEQIDAAGVQLSSINAKIAEKTVAMNELQRQIDMLNVDIDDRYASMKLRIKYMYEHNDEDILGLLLSSRSLSELLVRTEYVAQISDYDRSMLEQLNNVMAAQNANKKQLETDMSELTALKNDAESQISYLNSLLVSARSKYDANAEDIAESEALAKQYEQKLEAEWAADNMNSYPGDGGSYDGTTIEYTPMDLAMLAAIIECEAGNQPYEGLLAVGSVIINRVLNPRFDNTIAGVIYAPYQFSPVASGRFAIVLARGATERCVQAAQEVLNGHINIDALYFHAYNSAVDFGGTVIGDHVFY